MHMIDREISEVPLSIELMQLSEGSQHYFDAQWIDPLGVDDFMKSLPTINECGDVGLLLEALDGMKSRSLDIEEPTAAESAAIVRDFDFVIGSIIRHGGGDELKEDEVLLDELGRHSTNAELQVPRGTVMTQIIGNPGNHNARQRLFTGDEREREFYRCARVGAVEFERGLVAITDADFTDRRKHIENIVRIQTLGEALAHSRRAVKDARDGVGEWFSFGLRPYFDPLQTPEGDVYASGGSQFPMFVVDRILYGECEGSEILDAYFEEGRKYCAPEFNRLADEMIASLGGRDLMHYIMQNPDALNRNRIAEALTDLFKTITGFRMLHGKVAKDSLDIREDNDGQPPVGSGGQDVEILDELTRLSKKYWRIAEDMSKDRHFVD